MHSLPAYLLAVLTASVVISLEFLGVVTAKELIIGDDVPFRRLWSELLGSVVLMPFIIFFFALAVSAIPFAYFQSAYKQLNGTVAKYAAILFGVVVAFFGFELMDQLLPFPPQGHFAAALLSIAPGVLSGWVFHRSRKLSPDELTLTVDG